VDLAIKEKRMTSQNLFSKIIIYALMLLSISASALPICPSIPGSIFSRTYNLFDSAVTGTQTLKAKSSCPSLKIAAGERYVMVASAANFKIFEENSFFNATTGAPLVEILVPEDGDYVTSDTCLDPIISSDEIRGSTQNLRIFQNSFGVGIEHGVESCELKECPKYGACN